MSTPCGAMEGIGCRELRIVDEFDVAALAGASLKRGDGTLQRMKLHSPAERARVLFVLAASGGLVSLLVAAVLGAAQNDPRAEPVSTFSIVAYDPETGDLGVAVQSKFFAVGPVVPFAAADVGVIATQSFANVTYGPRGLDMLGNGLSAEAVIRELTEADDLRDQRQLGIVDADGNAATFTGERCLSWAGGRTGEHFAAQGNILAGRRSSRR